MLMGILQATPGCERVVHETVDKLKSLGHDLVRFDLPRPFEAAGELNFTFTHTTMLSLRVLLQIDYARRWITSGETLQR